MKIRIYGFKYFYLPESQLCWYREFVGKGLIPAGSVIKSQYGWQDGCRSYLARLTSPARVVGFIAGDAYSLSKITLEVSQLPEGNPRAYQVIEE